MIIDRSSVDMLFHDETFQSIMMNLADRWEDEKQYEDINSYAKVFNTYIAKFFNIGTGHLIAKMTKRPFGIKIVTNYMFTLKNGTKRPMKGIISIGIRANGNYFWNCKPAK